MTVLNDSALVIYSHSLICAGRMDLFEEDGRVDQYSGPNQESCRSGDEAAWHKPQRILFSLVDDCVACVGSVSSPSAYVGFVLQG